MTMTTMMMMGNFVFGIKVGVFFPLLLERLMLKVIENIVQ